MGKGIGPQRSGLKRDRGSGFAVCSWWGAGGSEPRRATENVLRWKRCEDAQVTGGLFTLLGWMALRVKIGPNEAEPEGCGGSTVKGENEVWPDFRRNPSGRGQFSRFPRRSSLADTRYPPHESKNDSWGPRVCVTPHSLNSKKTGSRRHRPSSVSRPQHRISLEAGLRCKPVVDASTRRLQNHQCPGTGWVGGAAIG